MSPKGRPEGEYRSAQHGGGPIPPKGRPEGESLPLGGPARSAKGVPSAPEAPVLRATGLVKAFGGIDAVRDVSFTVAAGEIVALIGPNGAGKTTTFNLVNGQLRPDAGAVHLGDSRIDGLPARAIARRGVARTFQIAATFASMSVRENVQLALLTLRGRQGSLVLRGSTACRDEALAVLARVGMTRFADRGCATLAYGDAKRVELAVALAARPRLLLMDEPTAGMSMRSRDRLMALVARLAREERIAVLFTEHDVDVVFAYADRVIVLDRGRIIASGPPAAIRADPQVRAVYLGEETNPAA